jgi:AraC-like DNA-binding protein
MVTYEYDHTDFHQLLKEIASRMEVVFENDTLRLPPGVGEGYLRAIRLPNGLSALVCDFRISADLRLRRVSRTPHWYILALDDLSISGRMEQVIGGDHAPMPPPLYSGVTLHSTVFDNVLIATKGSRLRSVRVLFEPRWLYKYFGVERDDELLMKYISLKARKLLLEPLDVEYRKYLDAIFSTGQDDPLYYTVIENRVMWVIERFMNRIMEKMEGPGPRLNIEDVYKMMELEAQLTKDSEDAPSVAELADRFGMSQTKLKTMFRSVYGSAVYEYYQRHRMEKARAMLLSGDHTVKEVGYTLGYKSLSNFAKAFRQVFGYAPSDITRSRKYAG